MTEISAIKVVAPNVLQQVVDDAIQIHGGAGLSRRHAAHRASSRRRARCASPTGPTRSTRALIARLELAKRGVARERR